METDISVPFFSVPLAPIDSSNIASLGYDEHRRILAVEFKHNGDIWHYANVDAGMWERLSAADSKGSFFYHHIKGKFPALKMTGPCPSCGDRGVIGVTCSDCGTAKYAREPRADKGPDA